MIASVMILHALYLALAAVSALAAGPGAASDTVLKTHITTLVFPATHIHRVRNAPRLPGSSKQGLEVAGRSGKVYETPAPSMADGGSRIPIATASSIDMSINKCWRFAPCDEAFDLIRRAYDRVGGMTDPNDRAQSKKFQDYLCKGNPNLSTWHACPACFLDNPGNDTGAAQFFNRVYSGFCGAQDAYMYAFLFDLLDFERRVPPAPEYELIQASMTDIVTFAPRFTPSSPEDRDGDSARPPSSTSSTPSPGSGLLSSATSMSATTTTVAPGNEAPASLSHAILSRISGSDPNFPYSEWGRARRPGSTATWMVRGNGNGNGNGSNGADDDDAAELAYVVVSLQWFPRPLGRQKPLVDLPQAVAPRNATASNTSSRDATSPSTRSTTTTTTTTTTTATRSLLPDLAVFPI